MCRGFHNKTQRFIVVEFNENCLGHSVTQESLFLCGGWLIFLVRDGLENVI